YAKYEISNSDTPIIPWVKVDGKLNNISVADDGTVWGVGLNNEIYRRKAADSAWENVPGTFKQVYVAADGTVWGITSDNKIYSLKDDNGAWEMVPGVPLKQVSVAADGTAWGINSNNEIYRRKDNDSNWERILGSLVQISHGSDSNVWGVNSKDKIYRRKADNSGWQNISGALRQISVATDGTVWGVNGKGIIYRRNDYDGEWIKMISYNNVLFKTVSAGSSTNIWALDKNGDIYYCNGPSDSSPGPFGGKGSSVGIDGGWGYGGGGAGKVHSNLGDYFNAGSGGGSCGGQILETFAGGGGYSWMNGEYISKEFQIIRQDGRSGGSPRKHPKNGYAKYEIFDSDTPFTPWVKIDGKLKDISVADGGTVWGVDKNNEIYRRNADDDSAWEKVPGVPTQIMSIVQLSHGSDSGNVWGVNSNYEIYHRKDDNSYWGKVPGLLKQISVAADGTVWGVNSKNEIYRREYDNRSWIWIPG
ncbi:MAG: hypothetical protein GY744_04445, partial [Gammaproteobacteria bacterium]|nr:hypothetical protein [Gammaproteobacteria bacterium]